MIRNIVGTGATTTVTGSTASGVPTMSVSKRSLGEGYIVAIGVMLSAVLLGQLFRAGTAKPGWIVAVVPPLTLVGAFYWLQQLDLTSDQVWTVAKYSAAGLGSGTVLFFGPAFFAQSITVTTAGFMFLGTTLAMTAVVGAFAGVIVCLCDSSGALRRQNAVLHRVLRHNLRNDMSVVMCMLDDIEATSDGKQAETAREAREKVRSVVELTDKIRQANVPRTERTGSGESLDVARLVEEHVQRLREEHPDLDIETGLSSSAAAYVDETFGLVVDNVVESAIENGETAPELKVTVRVDHGEVALVIEDYSQTLPDAEFAAVAAGAETALEHGLGVELWLVDWLVAANDGDVTFQERDGVRRVTIKLDRARSGWLR